MLRTICLSAFIVLLAGISSAHAGSPRLARIVPPGGQRGTTLEVYLNGRYLDQPREVMFYEPGIAVEAIEPVSGEVEFNGRRERVEEGTRVRVRLNVADNCELGPHGLRLLTANGLTEYQRFFVGPFPTVDEDEPNQKRNDKLENAKDVPLNSTVLGRMNDPPDVDTYRVTVRKGERISAETEAARIGVERGIPDLYLAILDPDGKPVAEADDSALFVQDPLVSVLADRDGAYFVQVRHSIYNAAGETYRLHVGNFPRPTGLYPAGGPAGTELNVKVLGDPRGAWSTSVRLPGDVASPGLAKLVGAAGANASHDFPFVAVDADSGVSAPSPNTLRVSPFPNVLEAEPNDTPEAVSTGDVVELPVAFNGIIEKPGDVDCFRFKARKGDRFKVQALAQALGSPLDPTIWIKSLGARPGAVLRATDSRLNQLGEPAAGGLVRETLDPIIEFTVPADGEYVLGIEGDRQEGGADYVYRVECQPEVDAVFTYIPAEPENRFSPQIRQAVIVPAGNRYNTQVAIVNTNRPFNGDLELVAVGLPEGVTMSAPHFSPGMTRVPVVFEAAAGIKPQARFIDLMVKPVVESTPAVSAPASTGPANGPAGNVAAAAGENHVLISGYRQVVPMNQYNNNDYYLHTVVDKLAFAVTEPAPFTVEVEDPKSALVQNGETSIKFVVRRADGYDGPVTVSMEWKPNGVSSATPLSLPSGKSEGEYLLGAARNATAGAYQVTLTAVTGESRANYNDRADRTYVASKPFLLTVAEPHLEARFPRTSIERGKTAQLVCKLNHLKPFSGKARATLARLPRGVELVEPVREVTSEDKEVSFTLRATEDCLVGSYQGVVLDLTVVDDGQTLRQLSGSGMLRVDAERGVKPAAK